MKQTNHAAPASDEDAPLLPLLLSAEFEAEDQEPEHSSSSSTGGVGVDLLNLKADPQLARFFEACEGQNPAVHELLLMSCSGFRRAVDARLLAEARRPVVQAPEKSKTDATATAAATSTNASTAATSSDASAAASTSTASAASSSTSARLSDWLRNKMKKDGSSAAAGSSDDRDSPASAASPSPPSSSSSSSSRASPSSSSSSFAPNVNNPSRSGPLQRHAPPARRHSQSLLGPDDEPPPMSYSGSAVVMPAKSNGRSASRAAGGTLSSLSSASAALAADAERRLRLDRAPVGAPPSPCTLLLTNLALYLLPPSVPVEIEADSAGRKRLKHFLVYNDYERIALPDVSLVSLPYRSGLTRHGTDFALRITDFCLHLRNGETSVWLQAPRNGRSMIVESLSDAFENLTGRALEMQQVDYAEVIADVLSSAALAQPTSPGMPAVGRIPEAVHEAASAWWRSRRFVRQGYLFHRSMHVYPAIVDAESDPASAASSASSSVPASPRIEFRSAPATEWVHSFVGLTTDGRLMEFRSSQEFSSFAYVASAAAQGKTTGKFPSRLDLNAIDLTRASLFLRSAAVNVAPDGFELIVYPRSSSMAAPHTAASDSSVSPLKSSRRTLSTSKDGIHGSAIAAAAGAGGAANQPAALEYGYTRHLFQVPLPPIPPSQLAAAAAAATAAQGQQGLSANQRRMQQQSSGAAATSDAAAAPPSKEHLKRLAVVEADLQGWMRALTFAMTGVAPPASGLALQPLANPVPSPARSAPVAQAQELGGSNASAAAAEQEEAQELEGPKPRYSLGAVSSPKSTAASPAQLQQKQKRTDPSPSASLGTSARAPTTAAAASAAASSNSPRLAPPALALPALSPSSAAASDDCMSAIPISPSPTASPLSPVSGEHTPSPSSSPGDVTAAAVAKDSSLAQNASEPPGKAAAAAVAPAATVVAAPTEPAVTPAGAAEPAASGALSPDEFSATIAAPLFDTDPQASPHGAASPIHAEPVPPLP